MKVMRDGRPVTVEVTADGAGLVSRAGTALVAGVGKRWWHCSLLEVARVLTRSYFDSLGIPRLT